MTDTIASMPTSPRCPEERFHFFLKMHKSIVSPDFYRAVSGFSKRSVTRFVAQMCLLTALISGFASTYYAFDADRGLPTIVSSMFPGMSIKNGVLDPGSATPYIPPASYVVALFNMLSCAPGLLDFNADSFVIVDTSSNRKPAPASSSILLTTRAMMLQSKSHQEISFPYSKIFPLPDTIVFSQEGVSAFLKRYRLSLFLSFFLQQGMLNAGIFFMSILFLTVAAYILKTGNEKTYGFFFKKACFAITPVCIGANAFALAGMHLSRWWYFFLILSAIVLFRGIHEEKTHNANNRGKEQ